MALSMHGALAAALEAARFAATAHAAAVDALERAFDAGMAQLATDRLVLEGDRAAFIAETEAKLARDEELQERVRAAAPPPGEKIKLNVGGARFETSRGVLTKVEDSMLGRMFGRCDAMLQPDPEDGSIFIDRDGERFRLLLDFLRDLDGAHMQRTIRAFAEAAQESMMKELDYFGLEAAVFGTPPWTDNAAFQPGPEMGSRSTDSAVVFAGGRVVVFGGFSSKGALSTTLLLDAQTMAFTAGPKLLTRRSGCAAVQIDADRVLVVGGYGGRHLNTTEIFHLSTLTFTPGPNMQSARNACAAVALDARRILVVGGHDGVFFLSTTEIFSLDTMAFAPGPAMATRRKGCAAVALDEHRILVAGGMSTQVTEGCWNTTEVLDIRTMAFALGPSMSSERSSCAAVHVDARHVLVIGGQDAFFDAVATTELLDVATMQFAPGPAMWTARNGCAAVRVDVTNEQPRVVVIGGEGLMTHDNDSDEDESEEDEEEDEDTVTNEQPRVVVIGGEGLMTRDNDSDEDESEEDEEEEKETILLSSTEVLAVEQNRSAALFQR